MIIKDYIDKSKSIYIEYDSETRELNISGTFYFMKEPFLSTIKEFLEAIE